MGDDLDVRLREERLRRNLTQAQLAELIGVSRKTINTVENGVFVPSTVLALRLALALGTTVEQLFHLRAAVPPAPLPGGTPSAHGT